MDDSEVRRCDPSNHGFVEATRWVRIPSHGVTHIKYRVIK